MNISVLTQSVKSLKTTAMEDYVYTLRDDFFGDILFSMNTTYINICRIPNLSDDYYGKMISIDCAVNEMPGFETWFGVLDSAGYTYQYMCRQKQKKVMSVFNNIKRDIQRTTSVYHINNIHEDEAFYNNILCRKASDGAGRYIIKNINWISDKVLYVAPCMLPGSKKTPLDMTIYEIEGSEYFVVSFTTHKPSGDVKTIMRMLNV